MTENPDKRIGNQNIFIIIPNFGESIFVKIQNSEPQVRVYSVWCVCCIGVLYNDHELGSYIQFRTFMSSLYSPLIRVMVRNTSSE